LAPANDAGLGLARAVSVVSVSRQSELLADYKLIPLSGAQLVSAGTRSDIRERRRIEIRGLRKMAADLLYRTVVRGVVTERQYGQGIIGDGSVASTPVCESVDSPATQRVQLALT
jgi:hypothetical protein